MENAKFIETIQSEHDHLQELLAILDEAQVLSPTLDGGWSIKDLMAHVSAWEKLCTGWIEMYLQGKQPDPFSYMRGGSNANEQIFEENQDVALAIVRENFSSTYQSFLQHVQNLVNTISTDELNRPQPWLQQLPWLSGQSLVGLIADNSYDHYRNHGQQIRMWLATAKS